MNLYPLEQRHYQAVYEIALRSEPWTTGMMFEQFRSVMEKREGFVLVNGSGEIVGCISFSDYAPQTSIIIHCVVDTKYQRRWCTRSTLKEIARYVFDDLDLHRMSGFCIVGKSDKAGEFLVKLGFEEEGIIRKGVYLPDGHHDLKLFGLLKEECKWL